MSKKTTPPARAQTAAARSLSTNPIQRILVVDDDPFICHRNAEVLIRHGYEVNATEDSAAGWKELQANPYQLLITENELPHLTGIDLVKKLRSARMAVPVIVATEKNLPAHAARQLRIHPVVTLLKPYTLTEFLDAVKVILGVTDETGQKPSPPNWQGYLPADDLRL